MAVVTLRVLDGADRGRVFSDIPTPLSVGREEGNAVQLNDERISRFHLKIQEERGKIVLTDLESTNGTKLNGETVQLGVLRPGDVICLGRTVLLFGSREEIARRLADLRGRDLSDGIPPAPDEWEGEAASPWLDFELSHDCPPDDRAMLHVLLPPGLPEGLTPGQAAELAELLQFFHLRLRGLIQSVQTRPKSEQVTLELRQWQNLVDLQDRIARYLRQIGEPGE
jgi:hypothetical protein